LDNRLKKRSDFDRVFKKGKKVYSGSLMFLYLRQKSLKIGYSVSKKNGGAVVRNRVKRLLRAVMREYVGAFKEDYYIIIIPRPASEYSYHRFKQDIECLLKREKLIND